MAGSFISVMMRVAGPQTWCARSSCNDSSWENISSCWQRGVAAGGGHDALSPCRRPLHYPQFCAEFRPIPKGLRPPAQGCRVREATLGAVTQSVPTPTGLRPAHDDDATPLGLRPSPRGFPRVARRSQPWALSRNPFVIRNARLKSSVVCSAFCNPAPLPGKTGREI